MSVCRSSLKKRVFSSESRCWKTVSFEEADVPGRPVEWVWEGSDWWFGGWNEPERLVTLVVGECAREAVLGEVARCWKGDQNVAWESIW